jgi:hypothetical protein
MLKNSVLLKRIAFALALYQPRRGRHRTAVGRSEAEGETTNRPREPKTRSTGLLHLERSSNRFPPVKPPSFRQPPLKPFKISHLNAKLNLQKVPIDSTPFAKIKTYRKKAPNPPVRGFLFCNHRFAKLISIKWDFSLEVQT